MRIEASGTLQIRSFSSFIVSFSLLVISRRWCRAVSALPLRHRITRYPRKPSIEEAEEKMGRNG
jgi:hypothetical protein